MRPFTTGFPLLPFPLGPAPTISSVTSVGTSGGSATCNGTNFVATPTASVNISGTTYPLTVSWISSTQIVELLLSGGPYTAGSWNLKVTNPDGQSVTAVAAFEITVESTPSTIFGANLKGWFIASNAVTSGSNLVSIPDSSGNSNNLSVVSATPPTVIASDSRFGLSPTTIQMTSGNSTYLECPSFAIGGSGSCFIAGAVDYTGSGSQEAIAGFYPATIMGVYASAGNELGTYFGNFAYTSAPLLTAGPATFVGGNNPGTGAQSSLNGGSVTSAGSTSANTTTAAPLVIGAQYTGSTYADFATFAWPEIIVVNTPPTSAQILAYCQYLNDKYGVTQSPAYASSSPIPAATSGAAFRVNGNYFQPDVSVALNVGGTMTALTVVSNTTTIINCTCPSIAAGTYNLIITNTDGRSTTFNNVVTVQSATANAAVAAMNIFGLSAVGVYTGANVTLNSSTVSSETDTSGMGNHLYQATSSNQPLYHTGVSDTTFNDKPYLSANGTSQFLGCSAFNVNSSGSVNLCYCAVVSPGLVGSLRTVMNYSGGAEPSLQLSSTNVPEIYAAGYTAWGSPITGAQNVDALTGTSVTSINVANSGSPVTTTASESISGGSGLYMFANSGVSQFGNMNVAAVVVLNATPSGTQLGLWHTFCQTYYGTA